MYPENYENVFCLTEYRFCTNGLRIQQMYSGSHNMNCKTSHDG